jgi:hypothetical protein
MTAATSAHQQLYTSPAVGADSAAAAAAASGPYVPSHLPSNSRLNTIDHVAEVAALKTWLTQQSQELEAKQMMLQQRWQYLQQLSHQQGQQQHCQELDHHRHQVQQQMDCLRQQLYAMQAQQGPWPEQLAQAGSDLNLLGEAGRKLAMCHPQQKHQSWSGLNMAGIAELSAAPQQQQFAALLSALKAASGGPQQQQQSSIVSESGSDGKATLAALLGAVTAATVHSGVQRQPPAQLPGPQRAAWPTGLQGLLDVMQAAASGGAAQGAPARALQHSEAAVDATLATNSGSVSRAAAGGAGPCGSAGWLHHPGETTAARQPPDAASNGGGNGSAGDAAVEPPGDDCQAKMDREVVASAMSVDQPSSADMPDALAPLFSMLRNMSNSNSASFTLGSMELTDMLEATLAEAQRSQQGRQQQASWQSTPDDGEFDMKRHNSFNSRPYQRPRLATDNNSTVQGSAQQVPPSTAGAQPAAGSTGSNGWSNLDALSAAAAALAAAGPLQAVPPPTASSSAPPTGPPPGPSAGKGDALLLQQVQQLLVAAGAAVGSSGGAEAGSGGGVTLPAEMDAAAVLRAALN